ncbi:hypothetical protein BD779DRAFT_781639 [Infundibulicybe gibba]|nr:hypothetical protein BD779DRAFT_781639 [Infundibulicybe gibba]
MRTGTYPIVLSRTASLLREKVPHALVLQISMCVQERLSLCYIMQGWTPCSLHYQPMHPACPPSCITPATTVTFAAASHILEDPSLPHHSSFSTRDLVFAQLANTCFGRLVAILFVAPYPSKQSAAIQISRLVGIAVRVSLAIALARWGSSDDGYRLVKDRPVDEEKMRTFGVDPAKEDEIAHSRPQRNCLR